MANKLIQLTDGSDNVFVKEYYEATVADQYILYKYGQLIILSMFGCTISTLTTILNAHPSKNITYGKVAVRPPDSGVYYDGFIAVSSSGLIDYKYTSTYGSDRVEIPTNYVVYGELVYIAY